jgi:hypothetical protein
MAVQTTAVCRGVERSELKADTTNYEIVILEAFVEA